VLSLKTFRGEPFLLSKKNHVNTTLFLTNQFKIVNNYMSKLSEDISKSEYFYEFTKKTVFPTYHVIEAKKRNIFYFCNVVCTIKNLMLYLFLFFLAYCIKGARPISVFLSMRINHTTL
jgi:hypothetical protein